MLLSVVVVSQRRCLRYNYFGDRIVFLNKIISSSLKADKYEILILYKVRNVIKNNFHYNAYLFKDSENIKNKIGISSVDKHGNLKAVIKV